MADREVGRQRMTSRTLANGASGAQSLDVDGEKVDLPLPGGATHIPVE